MTWFFVQNTQAPLSNPLPQYAFCWKGSGYKDLKEEWSLGTEKLRKGFLFNKSQRFLSVFKSVTLAPIEQLFRSPYSLRILPFDENNTCCVANKHK